MNIQLIAVGVIGIAVAGVLVRSIYRFFRVKRKPGCCNGCKECDLHRRGRTE